MSTHEIIAIVGTVIAGIGTIYAVVLAIRTHLWLRRMDAEAERNEMAGPPLNGSAQDQSRPKHPDTERP